MSMLFAIFALCIYISDARLCSEANAAVALRGGEADQAGSDDLDMLKAYAVQWCQGECIRKKKSSITNTDKTTSCTNVGHQPELAVALSKQVSLPRLCEWTDKLKKKHPGYRATCKPRWTAENRFSSHNPGFRNVFRLPCTPCYVCVYVITYVYSVLYMYSL